MTARDFLNFSGFQTGLGDNQCKHSNRESTERCRLLYDTVRALKSYQSKSRQKQCFFPNFTSHFANLKKIIFGCSRVHLYCGARKLEQNVSSWNALDFIFVCNSIAFRFFELKCVCNFFPISQKV